MIAEFSIMPVGKGESLSEYVAEMVKVVSESGLESTTGPMSTSVEGDWDEVMGVIKRCRDKLLENSNRIYLIIKIDERKGASGRLRGKVKSVEQKLGRDLK